MVELTYEAILSQNPEELAVASVLESLSQTGSSQTAFSPKIASPKTITVWGPGGSPGRSTLAINLSDSIARLGYSVLLIDADLFNPSLPLMLGVPLRGHTLSTLFAELNRNPAIDLKDFVTETDIKGLSLMPGITNLARASEIQIELFAAFLSAAQRYDYLVFDVAGDLADKGLTSNSERIPRFLVREAQQVIAVGEANILGLERLARQVADLRRLRFDRQVRFVLNRVEPKPRSTVDAAELFWQLTKERVSATLPQDRKTLATALERGCPASVIRQRGEFSKAVLSFAATLVTP